MPDLELHWISWGNVEWGRSLWSLESESCASAVLRAVVGFFFFFFISAHTGAVLLHSILSCGVMDLLPAAYGTGCTESARALFPPQPTQNILKYMQANAASSVHHSKVEYL